MSASVVLLQLCSFAVVAVKPGRLGHLALAFECRDFGGELTQSSTLVPASDFNHFLLDEGKAIYRKSGKYEFNILNKLFPLRGRSDRDHRITFLFLYFECFQHV